MIRWLVTGARGMLGRELVDLLDTQGDITLTAAGRDELDITDPGAVAAAAGRHDIIVNTAAWTDVDGAERAEAQASAVNGTAVAGLARACARTGAVLLHLSTDYVFDGAGYRGRGPAGGHSPDGGHSQDGGHSPDGGHSQDGGPGPDGGHSQEVGHEPDGGRGAPAARRPYPEQAPTAPINAYGRGKLLGERAVLTTLPRTGYVVRTAWLYGEHGRNFVSTMLRLAARHDTVSVVDDQLGQPTWAGALAGQLIELGRAALAGRAAPGVYHGTAAGAATWYELARAAFVEAGLDPDRVRPISSAEYAARHGAQPARRPAYSVLGHDRWAAAGLAPLPQWRAQLSTALGRPGLRLPDLSPREAV